jgi:lipopolysaccharide exporter
MTTPKRSPATPPGETQGVHQPLADKLISGAGWMVAMRWSVQAIGMINTLIMVRLLTPEDFGLVAMAVVVLSFVNAFSDVGMDMALIRLPRIEDTHYHTAWTLAAALGIINSCMLLLSAPYVARFYGDPRLLDLLYALAALPLLNGLANIRLADFRRELQFSRDFMYTVASRAVSLPLTVGIALYFRNYWALVGGMLIQSIVALIIGYLVRPHWPRICFKQLRSLAGFSFWVQVRSVGTVLSTRIDQLYIGKILGSRALGGYQVMQEIADLATIEVVLPLGRALFPGYAQILDKPERFRNAFYRVIEIHLVLAFALGGGLFLVAHDLVYVMLGGQWLDFVGAFEVLAWAGAVAAILSATGPPLIALGHIHSVALAVWMRFGLSLLGLTLVAALSGELVAIAVSRLLVNVAILLLLMRLALRQLDGCARVLLTLALRPALACTAMIGCVRAMQSYNWHVPWLRLLIEVPLGALTYCVALLVLWLAMGRPDGTEREILSRMQLLIRRFSSHESAPRDHPK